MAGADEAMSQLENPSTTGLIHGLRYGIAVGNHDQTPIGDPTETVPALQHFLRRESIPGKEYYLLLEAV